MQLQDYLIKYWELIGFFALILFYGLWAYFRVDDHEKRITKIEEGKDEMSKTVSQLFERVGAIDAKLGILVKGYQNEKND